MRKYRKCPYCKSSKGFSLMITLGGRHEFHYDFKGNVLFNEREGGDDVDMYSICLNCDKTILTEKLQIDL